MTRSAFAIPAYSSKPRRRDGRYPLAGASEQPSTDHEQRTEGQETPVVGPRVVHAFTDVVDREDLVAGASRSEVIRRLCTSVLCDRSCRGGRARPPLSPRVPAASALVAVYNVLRLVGRGVDCVLDLSFGLLGLPFTLESFVAGQIAGGDGVIVAEPRQRPP